MSPAHLLKVGLASLALLAVPAGIDTRALIVDGTGAAMGTASNPIVTSGSGTAAAPITDATANPTTGTVQNFPMVWNGTTWDRWKDMAAANGQTNFTGVPAVAPFYLDTTGTPSVRRGVTAASTTTGITGIQVPGSGNLVWDATVFRPQLSDTSGRTVTVGASAAGAAVAGNPVLQGISDGTNAQTQKQAAVANGAAATGLVANVQYLSNGTNFDPQTGNLNAATILNPGPVTTTQDSADQTNPNAKGVYIFLNITAASGTGGLTVQPQIKDPGSGNYIATASLTPAQTTTGLKCYLIYPGGPTAGALTAVVSQAIPRIWRVHIVAGDASSYTYTVSLAYLL